MAFFAKSKQQLDHARVLLQSLRSSKSALEFEANFSAAVSAERAVFDSLRSEGASLPGFRAWHDGKDGLMRSDELLGFIHGTRVETFHRGGASELFVWPQAHVAHFASNDMGPPPEPGAGWTIGARGIEWVVNPGKPNEYRVPVLQGGAWQVAVGLRNGPKTHLGKPIPDASPVRVLEAAFRWFEEIVVEAEATFGSASPPR